MHRLHQLHCDRGEEEDQNFSCKTPQNHQRTAWAGSLRWSAHAPSRIQPLSRSSRSFEIMLSHRMATYWTHYLVEEGICSLVRSPLRKRLIFVPNNEHLTHAPPAYSGGCACPEWVGGAGQELSKNGKQHRRCLSRSRLATLSTK